MRHGQNETLTLFSRGLVAAFGIAVCACSGAPPVGGSDAGQDGGMQTQDGGDTPHEADGGTDGGALLPDGGETAACEVGTPSDALTVATDRGLVRGREDDGTRVFLGIPFAAPPTGENRFRAPQPAACFEEVLDATAYAPRCFQMMLSGGATGEEDCLYLNVWTPAPANAAEKRPVMVFIHGGANVLGSANAPVGIGNMYDGQPLAKSQDVVVVSLNYRLGAFGFLAHPALTEPGSASSGNNAILDQIAALRWVQANIAGFGGDPQRVMIFGESAGALNTCVLVASPMASGLFSSALMQSGECTARPLAAAESAGIAWAEQAGCAGAEAAACLRSLEPDKLLNTPTQSQDPRFGWNLPFAATVDGEVLERTPLETIERGEHNQVPLVLGSNADETELFLPAYAVTNCFQYDSYIESLMPDAKAQVLAQYPCLSYPFARWAAVAATTDAQFTCPARRIARAASQNQSAPVYRYFYKHGRAYGPLAPMRAFHSGELPFVFRTWGYEGYVATPDDEAVSNAMQGYWASLARAGNPNHTGAVVWPAYAATHERTLELDPTPEVLTDLLDAKCDFWDAQAQAQP